MTKTNKLILGIAIVQFIPTLLFPPAVLGGASIAILVVPLLLFALLGWGLVTHRRWALTLSIFVQGFNIIIRVLMLLPRIMTNGRLDAPWLITSFAAMILSMVLLVYLDKPDIQIAITA